MTFTSNNGASARSMTIGGADVLTFGPCGGSGPAPGPFGDCASFTKPIGLTEVLIDNTTPGPGCQNGTMEEVVLRFGCRR